MQQPCKPFTEPKLGPWHCAFRTPSVATRYGGSSMRSSHASLPRWKPALLPSAAQFAAGSCDFMVSASSSRLLTIELFMFNPISLSTPAKRSKARKRQETSAAIRLQAQIRMRQLRQAWIDEQHRLKLQSFLYQREENVQRRALRAWRMRIILDRRERDKMMLEKALTHFQKRLLCTSWTSWLRRTKESQRERRLLVFAVGHFRHRLSATTFTTWQKHAEEVVWRRKLLVKIFLCCVQLPAYNSRVMRYKASLAVNYHEIKHLRRGFSRIFKLAREEAARGRKAKAWHERRWEERAPRIAITAWSERAKQFKRSRLAKATADAAVPLFYKR